LAQDWVAVLGLHLKATKSEAPAYLQLSRAIADKIRCGKLSAGVRLPGSRTLASGLGLHRNTVLKAYEELLSEGWLSATHAKGTFVSNAIPHESLPALPPKQVAPFPFALPKVELAPFTDDTPPMGHVQLYGGSADLRLLPSTAIARAYRRALRQAPRLLGYGSPRGSLALRVELCKLLSSTRGVAVEPERLLITRGSQMGIYLTAAAMLQTGDVVVVEGLGYPPAWQALRASGARLVPCRVDASGLDVERLEQICERQRRKRRPVRAVYLTPHHQYPTTVTLAPGRRMTLTKLAAEFGFVVIEDDYDHEFHYDGQPTLPLASAFPENSIAYIGTFSKVLAPGFRLGFLVAPHPVIERATSERFYIDRQGDAATEAALAELLEDGEIGRHIRKTRWIYQERRDHCIAVLRETFGERLQIAVPTGGMALWIRCQGGPTASAWLDESRKLGLDFQLGKPFGARPLPDEFVRMGFAVVTPEEMRRAVAQLWVAWQRAERCR
jgi:GntR family transcriptional regulator / MocR family aminotransferase